MSATPQIWHYGLMARYWAEFKHAAPEAEFLSAAVRRFGEPALDLACGTGRLLLPLLRSGLQVDGCDISSDMIRMAREAADAEGLTPRLHIQAMHELALPRTYKCIYICDSFGLSGSRENDLECLRRCHRSLDPGGALLLNVGMDYASPADWNDWLNTPPSPLPRPWPDRGTPRSARDGSLYCIQFRTLDVDPLHQTFTREVRLERRVNGEVSASESYTLRGNMYLSRELVLMLRVAGFDAVDVQSGASRQAPTRHDHDLWFTAVR